MIFLCWVMIAFGDIVMIWFADMSLEPGAEVPQTSHAQPGAALTSAGVVCAAGEPKMLVMWLGMLFWDMSFQSQHEYSTIQLTWGGFKIFKRKLTLSKYFQQNNPVQWRLWICSQPGSWPRRSVCFYGLFMLDTDWYWVYDNACFSWISGYESIKVGPTLSPEWGNVGQFTSRVTVQVLSENKSKRESTRYTPYQSDSRCMS